MLVADDEPALTLSTSNTLLPDGTTPALSTQGLNYSDPSLFRPLVSPVTLMPQLPGSERTEFPLRASRFTRIGKSLPC